MSHKATYWLATLDPSLIKAGEFRVLFHLCDHHNDERNPERACFPSQETLMEKTALSNGGLNNCLNSLEAAGLLQRKRGTIPGTSTRRTYYILGCDVDLSTMQTPLSGDRANSSPLETAGGANSTFQGGKLQPTGEEPVREPVIRKKDTPIVPKTSKGDFEAFYAAFPRKKDPEKARLAYARAIKKVSPELILMAAQRYAEEREGQEAKYTKHPTSWLNAGSWANQPDETAKDFHDEIEKALRGTNGLQHQTAIDNRSHQHVPAAFSPPRTSRGGSEPSRTAQHGRSGQQAHLSVVQPRRFGGST